ncbi:fibrinogen-like protein 1 isoform X2 [Drosophila busckii]|uniref:fibrinogen-like protein 1 isoform X2 n=1 Tax=Drosophila busckii TaxID=30019 RepID=UPI00083E9CC3|nr:fibrinogen-like protein 1 isoform X2 [Drosophila busckii]
MRNFLNFVFLCIVLYAKVECETSEHPLSQSCDSFCFKTLKPLLGYASDTKLKLEECADLQSKLNDQQAITKNKIDLINVYKDLCENQTAELAALKQQLADIKNALISPLSGSCIRKQTDVYDIKVPGMEAFKVSCDSSLYNNGWTVIQRRQDGSENFNRNWTEYREGFGDIRSEFFIGLEKLYLLLKSQPHVLYIHLEDFRQEKRFALYTNFFIGNEDEAYALKSLGVYSDRDNDMKNGTCAESFESGWWFNKCYNCNLNGIYSATDSDEDLKGLQWRHWHVRPLKFVQMMIRPRD